MLNKFIEKAIEELITAQIEASVTDKEYVELKNIINSLKQIKRKE